MQEDTLRRFMRLLGCEGARDWIQWDERICDWRTRKLPLTIHDLQLGIPTGIRPNKWETSWFTLDIDTHSPYHPRNDPNAIERMISLLSENGLETIPVLSSMSNGHHIWGPTPKIPTQALSKFLHQPLTFNNYITRPGTLELFPNTRKKQKVKSNGIPPTPQTKYPNLGYDPQHK